MVLFLSLEGASGELPVARFPARVMDIDGKVLDVGKLAGEKRLVVVTLKAAWCPVCREQLARIKKRLMESRACEVTYLVLSPGPVEELKAIRRGLEFPFPFIEDKGLAIADSLGLRLSKDEIQPSVFILKPDLSVGWMQNGRGTEYFGDPELFKALRCADWI